MDHSSSPSQDPLRKSRRFSWRMGALIALLLIVATGTYTWFSLRSSCEVHAVEDASAFLISQLNVYDRLYQVAVTASRTMPDHPVNTMKQVMMDTQEVDVPRCVRAAKTELLSYMGTVILAFDEYRAGKEDASVSSLIRQSDVQYANFRAELRTVNQCAPNCLNLESIWNKNR